MALKKITREELDDILEQHKLWFDSENKEGNRADLSYLDLQGEDLENAYLAYADLQGANLAGANLSSANLRRANLKESNLNRANLMQAKLMLTDLRGSDLTGAALLSANFFRANLNDAIYEPFELRYAKNVNEKWFKRIVQERTVSNEEIEELREKNRELSEKAKILEEEREQGKINTEEFKKQNQELAEKNKLLEQQLTEAEEKARREITKDNIDKAIEYLKNPNAYIENQITIQNILAFLYGTLALISFIVMIRYISTKYEVFGSLDFEKATIISWLFYVSPIILLGSLAITLINQVNHRLKRILVLNERKRYVEAMGGTLKATVELTETDAEARRKIEEYMNEIVKNTIVSKSDVLNVEDSKSDQVKSLEILEKIKGLLKE